MKAYSYENDINFYDYIVFADNPEEAKSIMYEEAKAYARKHIAHVYAHDIDGVKVDESLKDIALYSLIELYMIKAWEQEKKAKEDEVNE